MRMRRLILVLAVIMLCAADCSAEDLRFIDSTDDSGYFVDADSIKIESPAIFSADMVIIRLNLNEMEIIDLRINHDDKIYVIRSSRRLSYDDRIELSSDFNRRPERGYSDNSLMSDFVQIALYGGD